MSLTLGSNAAANTTIVYDNKLHALHQPSSWSSVTIDLFIPICKNCIGLFKDHVKSIFWMIFISLWPWPLSVPDPHCTHYVFHCHGLFIYCTSLSPDQGVFLRPTARSAEGLLHMDCMYLSICLSVMSHISSPVIGRLGSWGLSHLAWVQ